MSDEIVESMAEQKPLVLPGSKINFKLLEKYEQIGQGAFGKVYSGKYRDTYVAIKEMDLLDESHKESFETEIKILMYQFFKRL